jgi:uncharacterized membrane protein AbrB (regulator of aidB expression)
LCTASIGVFFAACRSTGIECAAPAGGRQAGQWIIGTALGLYFTPLVAEFVTRMWWLLLFAAVFALALGCTGPLFGWLPRCRRTEIPGASPFAAQWPDRFRAPYRVDIFRTVERMIFCRV